MHDYDDMPPLADDDYYDDDYDDMPPLADDDYYISPGYSFIYPQPPTPVNE